MRRLALSPRLELKIPNTSQQSPGHYPPRNALWSMLKGGIPLASPHLAAITSVFVFDVDQCAKCDCAVLIMSRAFAGAVVYLLY
jgi:hypothetical protein